MLIGICNIIFAQLKELLKMHPILEIEFKQTMDYEVLQTNVSELFHSSSQGKQNKITCAHIYANQKRLIYG